MKKDCILYKTTKFLGKRWALLIILEIYKGKSSKKRYSEIKKNLPEITPKILSSRLKELKKQGLIKKQIDSSKFPIKCEYFLTESGKELIKIIKNIKKWALKYEFKNKFCEEKDCKECF